MANLFTIPVMPPRMPEPTVKREYPISPRENFLRALRHEKPMWMPNTTFGLQFVVPAAYKDAPDFTIKGDSYDWFGTLYKYEAAQEGPTPMGNLFEEIGEWKEKFIFPNLDEVDWTLGLDKFVRNPNRVQMAHLGNGTFERLHMSEGFEQALCDILVEPDDCRDFFTAINNYKIEAVKHILKHYKPDMFGAYDDWSNARAPFFSEDTFKHTLLDSAVAVADAVHGAGCHYMVHCCGFMEPWLPYIVNDLRGDLLEIQTLNDIRMVLDKYGSKTAPIFSPDPYIMYNPDTTEAEARAYARSIVDMYGAHTCEGSGAVCKLIGSRPDIYYAFEDELFNYSLDCYKNL